VGASVDLSTRVAKRQQVSAKKKPRRALRRGKGQAQEYPSRPAHPGEKDAIAGIVALHHGGTMQGVWKTGIRVMSSLAMKSACEALAPRFEDERGMPVSLQFVGGADIGKRLHGGEAVDLVLQAAAAIDDFIGQGVVRRGSRVDLVRSVVGVAVKSGSRRPDISSPDALRRAVEAARVVAYSSGPSGVYLAGVFERWGIARDKLRQTGPGIPAGGLLVTGEADIAFQQVSELLPVEGIDLVGPLPEGLQLVTVFSAGTAAASPNPLGAKAFTDFLTSAAVAADLARCGLEPA